jgi:diguanylate cyclase (GGDEF)-like protein
VKLIFKNLNVLRSMINDINASSDLKEIVESAGTNLSALFDFSSFGMFWKDGHLLHLYQEESCPPSFTQEVVKQTVKVFSTLTGETLAIERVNLHVEKKRLNMGQMRVDPMATLKSYLTLPIALEGEILGCISINSDQPNAFDAQDLQFFSVIGYQMTATIEHLQRLSSVKNLAIYDTLTGLYNRRYFDEKFGTEAQQAFVNKTSLSLVLIDIDHFKKVNDTFGHPEGDKILRGVASLLKNSVRKKDTVARYGGEEFILILPEANLEAASMIAERIRKLVENTSFDIGNAHLNATISLGISSFPSHRARSKEELLKMADLALYRAKGEGRNRVSLYDPAQG